MDETQDSTRVSDVELGWIAPTYAAAFQCIGPACEDHCCGEWDIPLDKTTYQKYKQFPKDKLGLEIEQFVGITPARGHDGWYAQINRRAGGCCPFFGGDHLCGIQKEYGPGLLSATCSIYPRSLSWVGGQLEASLSVSCPEAARNVLLDPEFARVQGNIFSGAFRTDNTFYLAGDRSGSGAVYRAVRAMAMGMVLDRSRPLWQRLLVVGRLCERLGEAQDDTAQMLNVIEEYRRGAADSLSEVYPSDPKTRLEVVFGLSDLRIRDGCGSRFQDVFWTFVEGIGSPIDGVAGDDLARFLHAEEEYHRPYFEASPFILENYVINYMFFNLFPFGHRGGNTDIPRTIFQEYVLMTTQFAWVNALLIGISARYRESFAAEHVVKTVQSLTREVGHYPHALRFIIEYVQARDLHSVRGMAILLKS